MLSVTKLNDQKSSCYKGQVGNKVQSVFEVSDDFQR